MSDLITQQNCPICEQLSDTLYCVQMCCDEFTCLECFEIKHTINFLKKTTEPLETKLQHRRLNGNRIRNACENVKNTTT